MAWIYYKGVQAERNTLINGSTSNTQTNVHTLVGDEHPGGLAPTNKGAGCVRTIYPTGVASQMDAKADMCLTAGIPMFMPTLEFDPNSLGYGTGVPIGSAHTGAIKEFHEYGQACKNNGIKYIELVNELVEYNKMPKTFYEPGSHTAGTNNGNWGPKNAQRTREVSDIGITGNDPRYIVHLVNAINVFKQYNVGVVTSGVPSGAKPNVDGEFWDQLDAWSATDIWALLDNNGGGIGYHPYAGLAAGTTLSTGVLGHINGIRNYIDSYGAHAENLPFLFTEYGVSAEVPGVRPQTLVYSGGTHDSRLNQVGNFLDQALTNWETHAETLKIVTICWFWLQDFSGEPGHTEGGVFVPGTGFWGNLQSYAYFGIRYDGDSKTRFNPGVTGVWKPHVKDAWDQHDAVVSVVPPPDPPPTCTTSAAIATNISDNAALVQATVNPKGTATNVVFQWGPTNAYGTSSAPVAAGAGNSVVTVQALMGILTPDTLYHFKATATSAAGTDDGGDKTLTSKAVAPLGPDVVTGPAINITGSSARLTGDIDPKGKPAKWHFEWGTDPTLGTHTKVPIPDADLGGVVLPPTFPLAVTLPGAGAGRVVSSPAGIDTNVGSSPWSHDFPTGTVVTLTQTPTAPDTFSAWSGDGTGTTTRTVTVDANRSVQATFIEPVVLPGPWTLQVHKTGAGSGRVVSSPAGIDTDVGSGPWAHNFADGTVVTLSQTHSGAYTFAGWTGSGTNVGVTDRQVTMTQARDITANFGVAAAGADFYVDAGYNGASVDGSAAHPFKTIQAGLNAAGGGDVVSVVENTYPPISFTKSGVTLRGQGDQETRPTITGAGTNVDHGLALAGNSTGMTIENFIIEDIQHTTNQMSGLYLTGNPGPHDNNFNNIAVRRILGPNANAGTAGVGMYHFSSYPYNPANAIRHNTFTGCEIYEIGAGSVDGFNECMGVFMSGCLENHFVGCDFYLIRKEAIRDLDGLRNTATGCHAYLCWSGISPNYGSGFKAYNNASYFNQIGFEPKHTGFYLNGGAAGTQHWGAGESASAANNRTIYAHNTTYGNIASSIDLGQGGDLFNFVTVKDNLWGDKGTTLLRDFTPIGGSIEVDHNHYNTASGTPPAGPRARYARDFPGTAAQDSSFPFSGYGGHTYETNGTSGAVTFTDPDSGGFNHSGSLVGEDLGDGYGTQVGCDAIGPAMRTWTQHTYTASTTMGGGSLAPLSDGAYDSAWTAGVNTGSITFDFGSAKSVGVIMVDTIIRQNGPGQYKNYSIQTSPDGSTWTTRRTSAVPDNLRTSTKHRWPVVSARYVRFNITSMQQGGGDRAEICQVRLGHL